MKTLIEIILAMSAVACFVLIATSIVTCIREPFAELNTNFGLQTVSMILALGFLGMML